MPASDTPKALFDAFPPTPTEAWTAAIERDLKGRSFDDALVWEPLSDLAVQPFYRNLPRELTTPDRMPSRAGGWLVRQDLPLGAGGGSTAKEAAVQAFTHGAEAIGITLQPGLESHAVDEILPVVLERGAEVHITASSVPSAVLARLQEAAGEHDVVGTVLFDPFALATQHGQLPGQAPLDLLASLLTKHTADLPSVRLIGLDLDGYHAAGATPVQELAVFLATLRELLSALTDRGLQPSLIARNLHVRVAVGTSYFVEIAKLRALRGLVRQVLGVYDAEAADVALSVQAITSGRSMTRYAPYVNMLRATTEAAAAVIGGCDTLTVRPFTAPQGTPDAFALRMARNTQLILRDEAYLDKVADPAAGSYYIEHLTEAIGKDAWALFQEIESKGGLRAALRSGFIQATIREAQQARMEALGCRRRTLVGLNRYPITDEAAPTAPAGDRRPVPDFTGDRIDSLPPVREGIAFEALRDRTKAFADATGRLPRVHLVLFGHPALRSARANFSRDFFGCAGFEITESDGVDTAAEAADALAGTRADVVVLCSSDDAYLPALPALRNAFSADDPPLLVVAGNPKADRDALQQAGIDDFIHMGTPLLATLESYQHKLGVITG